MKRIVPVIIFFTCPILLAGLQGMAQVVQTGKSYVNINKGINGGTIEPGDILEIRATIAVGNWDGSVISRVHYIDTIPVNTTYIPGSLKILTNEGLTFQAYTDAASDDAAMYDGTTAPRPTVRINMGSTLFGALGGTCTSTAAGGTSGGTIDYRGMPSFYDGVCIMSASYQIRVDSPQAFNTLINMYGGAFRYRNGTSGSTIITNACNAYSIALTENLGLCANAIGANAVIDNGGTFGSGILQNRSTSAIVPGYVLQNVTVGQPNDGSYAIVNNLSPSGSVNINEPKPDNSAPVNRVFNIWDIMGDHTGAADPMAGNPPVAPGDDGGYFVAINASYANNNAIQQTVGGLCPNTYYEFSAWFKNICQYCACDLEGDPPYRTSGGNYIPNTNFSGPDSSGVNPNLTFTIDGVDYYTTGNLAYTGQWVKKGFIYLTGPTQTSFTITIRNNAAGGGGNDWAIDDVTLATCTPNLDMQPSPLANVCYMNSVDIFAEVSSYFPNYTHWRWERSIDGGSTWNNAGNDTSSTPTYNNGAYEYTANYPTFLADSNVHNNIYRIRLASTQANLNDPACSFAATTTIVVHVNNCQWVLNSDILSFNGSVQNKLSNLQWTATGETDNMQYIIESSDDKEHFEKIGTVTGIAGQAGYGFTDTRPLTGPRYYRIRITDNKSYKISRIILLSNEALEFSVRLLGNPFHNHINIELVSPDDAPATFTLLDTYGRILAQQKEQVFTGLNMVQISEPGKLPAGMYVLQVQMKDKTVIKRLVKASEP